MQSVQQVRSAQQEWLEWFREALPEELRGAIVNVVLKGKELTLLAPSAAWSARLRYALDALGPKLKAARAGYCKNQCARDARGPLGPEKIGRWRFALQEASAVVGIVSACT